MSTETFPAVRPSRPEAKPQPQQDGHGGHDSGEHGIPTDLKSPSGFAVAVAVGAFVFFLVVLFLVGLIPELKERNAIREDAVERASQKPRVQFTYITPQTDSSAHPLVLPCNLTANQVTAIYTRTNGYLAEWKYDIGQHVEKDQLMAVIATPDVDAELAQSKANLDQDVANVAKAVADLDLANITYDRYVEAYKQSPGSVTKEDLDTHRSAVDDAKAALDQAKASVSAAQANVQLLATQVGFEKVYAPFSGTVTARNYDVGALLSPSNTAAGSEIFDLQQTDKLRVFVYVPQEYANYIKSGAHADVYVRNFPSRAFDGVVTLTAGAVDANTRTLRVQIDVDNKSGELFANEYGEVHLPVKDTETIGLIPTSALIFNAQATGNQVAVVGPDNKIHMKSILTRRDFGTNIEVAKGVELTDRIVTNPSERVSEGVEVDATRTPNGSPASQPSH